jgi:hypothetical protein
MHGEGLTMNNANLAVTETRHRFEVSLLHAFDEIARNLLKASHKRGYVSLQSYLDGGVSIGDAYFTRRAILLAIHDMKDELEAPLALQERALAELLSLKVLPKPELKHYRDIATALLRMEVVIRSTALRAMEYGETKH